MQKQNYNVIDVETPNSTYYTEDIKDYIQRSETDEGTFAIVNYVPSWQVGMVMNFHANAFRFYPKGND